MEQYTIHQLIYTKLNPEDSPFEKKDFHTAFYPLDFLSGTDVMVIENHIYIPTSDVFRSKQVACFQTIKQETYLLVFDIALLEGEVDTLGRGGIFLCHLFFFPSALWKQLPSPDMLLELVKDQHYKSRKELLSSSYFNRQNGNSMPLVIESEKVKLLNNRIPLLESAFEIQLLLHLIDSLKQVNKENKFIVSSIEIKARQLFNKLICYLPDELKIKTGWDTMYDGGRMMDYNKSFAAYQEKAPKGGGGATMVYLPNNRIELSTDFKTSKDQSPFAKWIAACSSTIEYHSWVHKAYQLSESITAKEPYDLPFDWNFECFANANKEMIDELFLQKCRKEFKSRIAKELNKILPSKDKLLYYYTKLEPVLFTEYLLIIAENSKISAAHLEKNIPSDYIKYNPVLVLIEQVWKKNKFEMEAFDRLADNQKLQLNRYLLKTGEYKKNWYLELIKNDEALRHFFIHQYQKPKKIISLFRKNLNMNEMEINQLGFGFSIIRKVLYFRIAYLFKRFIRGKK